MTAGLSPRVSRLGEVRWPRLATWAALAPITMLAMAQFVTNLSAHDSGGDFRGGIWPAGADVMHGRLPYAPADPHRLLVLLHSFITPPPLAILAIPFSLLAFPVALAVWNLMSAAAVCLALRLMGVRDQRIYLLAFCTLPIWDSFANGQPDGVFALAAALAWRFRNSWPGGVAAGALIAAKLLAWPLLIWMLVAHRIRSFTVTIGSAIVILLGSWALIGFKGLARYPSLLAADARAFETWRFSYSLVHALTPLGLSTGVSRVFAVAVALAIAISIIAFARRRDEGWFAAALLFGVLCSPILWPHYLVVLLVPLALAQGRRLTIWMVTAYIFWIAVMCLDSEGRAVAIPMAISVLLLGATSIRARAGAETAVPTGPATGAAHGPAAGYRRGDPTWSAT